MKSAILPQVRVEPELRTALEAVLHEGETLSEFVEATVRKAVEYRQVQAAFDARAQASLEEYQRTGESYSVDEVLGRLRRKTEARRAELKPRPR